MDQVTGVASSWVRDRAGRLALRGSAMAIEVALDIAPRNQSVAKEMAAETAPEVWDVWGGSSRMG